MTSQPHRHQRLKGLLALITLSLAASAGAVGTAAGTSIVNTATMSATDDAGNTSSASSSVTATVTQVYNVNVSPDGTSTAPGQTVYTDTTTGAKATALTYTLKNTGNGSDTFVLSTSAVSSTVTAANVTYYVPGNGETTYTPGTSKQVTGPISLAADASTTFFAVYTVPQGAAGGTNYDIDPQGQSVATGSSTSPAGPSDSNNYGRITETNDYNISFAATDSGTITSATGASKVYTSTLTNTGNVPLTASNISLTASSTDTTSAGATITTSGAFTESYTATYNGNSGTGTTPQAAVNALLGTSGTLPAGSAITLTNTLKDDGSRAAGDKDVLSLAASVTGVTNSAGVTVNNASTATTITKTTTVVKGASSITKTQALCGTSGSTAPANCPASSGTSTSGINVKPGDYVEYYLSATNSGTSSLFTTKVADALPAGVMIYSFGATVTGAASGTLLYSTDGSTWVSDPTKLSGITGGSTTLYVGLDTDGDGKITSTDTFAAGAKLLVRIKVKVNDGGTVQTAPVSDSQTIN